MSSITRFDGNGIELAIDNETGAAYATISGYARMSGISQTAMSNRLSRGYKGVHKKDLKEAEILTPGGLQGVHLMTADLVFEWMIEDNPSLGFAMGKTEPAYFPTEKGKPYSSNTIATGRKEDNTSYQHTKWVESMVETVRDLM